MIAHVLMCKCIKQKKSKPLLFPPLCVYREAAADMEGGGPGAEPSLFSRVHLLPAAAAL